MIKNQRGEVATLTVIAIAGVALLIGTLAPTLNPFNRLFGAGASAQVAAPEKEAWKEQTRTTEPVTVGITPTGDKVVAFRTTEEYKSGAAEHQRKLTFGERIGAFFAHLTTWGVVFVIVSLVFFGGAPILWLARKYLAMKQAMKNTVAGIRELKKTDMEAYTKATDHIAKKQDKSDNRIVDKLKAELH